jgi:hypothetical protein
MGWSWLIWAGGGAVLLAAGFGSALVPRLRDRRRARRVAWSTARAAISSAAISRDAAEVPVPEADRLLARAELLAADRGGDAAARSATEYARQADQLWRGTAGDQPPTGGQKSASDQTVTGDPQPAGEREAGRG